MTTANEKQIGGDHYKKNAIQPWDYIAANRLGYFEGCAIKYITRWKDKGGVKDLDKAIHFIEKLKEIFYQSEKDARIAFEEDDPTVRLARESMQREEAALMDALTKCRNPYEPK